MKRRRAGAWVSVDEAAELLGKPARTIRKMIDDGLLPAERLSTGKRPPYVILRSEVKSMPKKLESRRKPEPKCGTLAGYKRHKRRDEPVCASCRQARSAYDSKRPGRAQRARTTKPATGETTIDSDDLASLLVRQHAEQIMSDLRAEHAWATAQRREDLAEDVRLFARKRKRDRIMREAERRAGNDTSHP